MSKFIIIFFLFYNLIFAQNSNIEALSFYPLHIGNIWHYMYPYESDTTYSKIEVIGDTILDNGFRYKILMKKSISSDYSKLRFERVDSITANVYRYSEDSLVLNNEYLIDSLLAQAGDTCFSMRFGYDGTRTPFTLCSSIDCDTVLGTITEVKTFWDYTTFPNKYQLAKNIGLIYHHSEGLVMTWEYLSYARVNGKEFGTPITGIGNKIRTIPNKIELLQNYPNPFNSHTIINYYLIKDTNVELTLFDVRGAKIKLLTKSFKKKGVHKIFLDAKGFATGVYFYQLKSDNEILVRKMLLIQ